VSRRKRFKVEPMPFGTAIFLLIVGILLGSVFVFGARHWYADINKSDCTVVKTHILSCTEIERQGRHQSNYLRIDCANGERYDIHSTKIWRQRYNFYPTRTM
jgi:hypothetical protein